jgi:hypothetical protein
MAKHAQQPIFLKSGERKAQQVVYEARGLTAGKHTISIINRGNGKVAVDALIIK